MTTNITETNWQYPHGDPNLEIVGWEGLVQILVDIHGPNFEGTVFNPHVKNIRTGKLMSKPHHCTHENPRGHDLVRSCILKGHQSYCLQWIDAGGRRVRCGERLKVVSNGCSTHSNSMNKSMNLLVKSLKEGKINSIRWDQINDPDRVADMSKDLAEITKEENQAIVDKKDAEIAKMDVGEAVDPVSFSVHFDFEDRKAQKQRKEQEQRKLEAANKRKSRTGKTLKKITDEDDVLSIPDTPRKGFGKSIMNFGKKSKKPDASKWTNKLGGANA